MSLCTHNCSINEKYCAKKVSIFTKLTDKQMENITSLIKHKTYKKGETIFAEGDTADSLLIVNHGSLKVYTYTKDGKEQILYILTDGDFLGDLNLFKKNIFQYYGTALEDTRFCILYKGDFNQIVNDNPEIGMKILEYAYDKITGLERLIQTLTTKDVDSRLATLLINLAENFGLKTSSGLEITFPLSREDMANYLGLTRETVSRRLSSLQSENLIELSSSRCILIKDIKGLKELI